MDAIALKYKMAKVFFSQSGVKLRMQDGCTHEGRPCWKTAHQPQRRTGMGLTDFHFWSRFASCVTFWVTLAWLCGHGNLWDRSQSSVEAGGLFSNMADFCGRRLLEFLIWLLIDWKNLKTNSLLCFSASPAYRSFELPILLRCKKQILWTKKRAKHAAVAEGRRVKRDKRL